MLSQATVITLIAIEGAGLVITIGFGVAIFRAWRKSKKQIAETQVKLEAVVEKTTVFLSEVVDILNGKIKHA